MVASIVAAPSQMFPQIMTIITKDNKQNEDDVPGLPQKVIHLNMRSKMRIPQVNFNTCTTSLVVFIDSAAAQKLAA